MVEQEAVNFQVGSSNLPMPANFKITHMKKTVFSFLFVAAITSANAQYSYHWPSFNPTNTYAITTIVPSGLAYPHAGGIHYATNSTTLTSNAVGFDAEWFFPGLNGTNVPLNGYGSVVASGTYSGLSIPPKSISFMLTGGTSFYDIYGGTYLSGMFGYQNGPGQTLFVASITMTLNYVPGSASKIGVSWAASYSGALNYEIIAGTQYSFQGGANVEDYFFANSPVISGTGHYND